MNIQAQKIELAQMIFQTENKSLLKKIRELLVSSEEDFLNELHDDVKKSVKISLRQLEEGKGIAHSDVMKKVKKWQSK